MTAHELTHTIRNDMPVYPGTGAAPADHRLHD